MESIAIMITTKNREKELDRTLQKLSSLDPQPSEIMITADGCSDNTAQLVKSKYPQCKLIINEIGIGSVASRSRMMRSTKSDLVLALDDDSYPLEKNFLQVIINLFNDHPKLAVATFPQKTDEYPETLNLPDFGQIMHVGTFPNSGACFRVSVYQSLPGFEHMFFHMYEEPDYALQCIANGWEVKIFPGLTIRHHFTKNSRNEIRNHHFHARNEFWSILLRCPSPYLFILLLYRIIKQGTYAIKRGPKWIVREPSWWLDAIRKSPVILKRRRPYSWRQYKSWLNTLKGINS